MTSGKGIDRDHVRYLAGLAKLDLGDQELSALTADLVSILEYFAVLDALDLDAVEPMAHPLGITARVAPDVPRPGLPMEAALREASWTRDGHFAVPPVVELTLKPPCGDGEP